MIISSWNSDVCSSDLWPQLPFFDLPPTLQWAIMDWSEDVHHVLVLTLAVLIPLHIAAALKHHFWDRHDVLRGILPEIPDEKIRPEAKKHRQRGNGPRPDRKSTRLNSSH